MSPHTGRRYGPYTNYELMIIKTKYDIGDFVYVIETKGYVKGWFLKYQEAQEITEVHTKNDEVCEIITYEIEGTIEPEYYVVKTKQEAVLMCYELDKQRRIN